MLATLVQKFINLKLLVSTNNGPHLFKLYNWAQSEKKEQKQRALNIDPFTGRLISFWIN